MKHLDRTLEALEVKNCIFRINRDIRFSKDKSPYKTYIGVWLSQNKNQKSSPGYYIHYEKGNSFIAGGVWCPESNELKKIRKEINFFYEDLQTIVSDNKFKKVKSTSEFKSAKTFILDKSFVYYLRLRKTNTIFMIGVF